MLNYYRLFNGLAVGFTLALVAVELAFLQDLRFTSLALGAVLISELDKDKIC